MAMVVVVVVVPVMVVGFKFWQINLVNDKVLLQMMASPIFEILPKVEAGSTSIELVDNRRLPQSLITSSPQTLRANINASLNLKLYCIRIRTRQGKYIVK